VGAVKVSAVRNDVCHYGHTTPSRIYIIIYVFAGYKSSTDFNAANVRLFLKLASKKQKNFRCGAKVFCKRSDN